MPSFNVRFEKEDGFVNHRFYESEPGQPIIAGFLKAPGLKGKEVDTQELISKRVSLEVEETSYADPQSGQEKTIKQSRDFSPCSSSLFYDGLVHQLLKFLFIKAGEGSKLRHHDTDQFFLRVNEKVGIVRA